MEGRRKTFALELALLSLYSCPSPLPFSQFSSFSLLFPPTAAFRPLPALPRSAPSCALSVFLLSMLPKKVATLALPDPQRRLRQPLSFPMLLIALVIVLFALH